MAVGVSFLELLEIKTDSTGDIDKDTHSRRRTTARTYWTRSRWR